MEKSESFYEFWPVRVPLSLPLPETSVFDNPQVSASRYPGKAAIIYSTTGGPPTTRRPRSASTLRTDTDVRAADGRCSTRPSVVRRLSD